LATRKAVKPKSVSPKFGKPKSVSLKFGKLKCIGNICFNDDGEIVVKVPKKADSRCARRIAQSILGGKQVHFEVEGKPPGMKPKATDESEESEEPETAGEG